MTITYRDGTVVQAIVLSHAEHEIRAVTAGCDDALAFTRLDGTWLSQENEPVAIEFAWEGRHPSPSYSEDDYLCPKQHAARLISMLLGSTQWDSAGARPLYVFSAKGARVAIHRTELTASRSGASAAGAHFVTRTDGTSPWSRTLSA
jgi:hypothetical protein